tara:strand:- start:335 stop:637 length:303 start_codon:yes stop_codon:yes gene_type:complete
MKNIDITEWMLDNHIDSDTEIVMDGKQVFLADVLEKHLKDQFAIPIISGSYTKEDAMKWYDGMIKEEWIRIEKKHGYYGHDIGTTEADIEDMYKAEFNYR